MDAVQQSLAQMMEVFTNRLDVIQEQLPTTPTGSPGTSNLAQEFASFKTFAIATFRALQSQIALLASQVDQSEMRMRRKILLVHGLSESEKEETNKVAAKLIVERLKLPNFSTADISRCHRMGRAAADRPRPILVKVRDVTIRDKIWAAKTCLKGSGITLSEFLTKARHDVFLAARQRFGVSKCWTRDGNIFVLGSDGTRHRVNCSADLAAIISKELPADKPKATEPVATGTAVMGSEVKGTPVKPKPKRSTRK